MSLIVDVLEFVLDFVTDWRMYVSLAATALMVWLILEYGPQNTAGHVIAIGVAIAGFVLGWRWSLAAEAR